MRALYNKLIKDSSGQDAGVSRYSKHKQTVVTLLGLADASSIRAITFFNERLHVWFREPVRVTFPNKDTARVDHVAFNIVWFFSEARLAESATLFLKDDTLLTVESGTQVYFDLNGKLFHYMEWPEERP
ncbi:MAG: hypothetical protein LBQ83_01820 [Candidatus Margulisbacteria bacterium]|jgi:hypothetical protein|nr:hypothetical protein [Candidatus Margulisiibacteriota bacterium]